MVLEQSDSSDSGYVRMQTFNRIFKCDSAESQGDGGTEEGVARKSHGFVQPSQGPSQRSKRDA